MMKKEKNIYRQKMWKRISSILLTLAMVVTMLPAMPAKADEIQEAWFPLRCLDVSRGPWEDNKHTGRGALAVDFKRQSDGEYAFAPFDGKIIGKGDSQHAVFFQSEHPVRFADGSVDTMTLVFMHGSNYGSLRVGDKFRQGQDFYRVGNYGESDGAHFHIETIKGSCDWVTNGYWTRGNCNLWDALGINDSMTKVKGPKSYPWKHLNSRGSDPSPSTLSISGETRPTGNLTPGKSFGIRGYVTSNYTITEITAVVFDSNGNPMSCCNCSYNPNSTSVNLSGKVNRKLIFNNLPAGSYQYVVTAADSSGARKEFFRQPFSVGSVSEPGIDLTPVDGGVRVSMHADNAAVYYTTNGADPRTNGVQFTSPFVLSSTANVQAVAIANGAQSNVRSQQVTVGSLSTPAISSQMGSNAVTVSMSADRDARIYYTTNGSNPSASSAQYTGAFQITNSTTIKAIAIRVGSSNSSVATKSINISKPSTPSIRVSGSSKIAVGDPARVSWNAQEVAYSYTVKLQKGNKTVQEKTVNGTNCAFSLPEVGEYTITVKANNFMGSSGESYPPVTVEAMAPLSVTLKDFDDTVICTQQVRYGYRAELPQNPPSRRGYNFSRWDNGAVYSPITESCEAKATYTKKRYIVKFVDKDGHALAPQQEVLFDESVNLPEDPTTTQEGYKFMGWRCTSADEDSVLDYEHVDSNMTLEAVFDWANKALPIILHIGSATRTDQNTYKVDISMTHYSEVDTAGRLLISLKTSNGKTVKTYVEEFKAEKGNGSKTTENIELICDKVATQIEVSAVASDGTKTTGTIAEAVTAHTTSMANAKWSDWSTSAPSGNVKKEEKTIYRWREKQTTDSTADSLGGWTQYGSPNVSYGGWGDTQSTTSNPGGSDTLEVTGTSATYYWYHYCNKYDGKSQIDSIQYGSRNVRHTTTSTWMFPALNIADKGGRQCYGGLGSGCPNCTWNFYGWWLDNVVTTYYYHTRSKTITYHYYRWGDWTGWNDYNPGGNDNRQVESQTVYRYLIPQATPSDGEDLSGEAYTESGKLDRVDLDLNGKKADILVYKATNNDPTENQLEYVGQTRLGEGNSYNFSFIPKETPDEADSNYIVALAIEGSTNLYNIDVLYASRPNYTVTFYDMDGKVIDTQEVPAGEAANAPEAPQVTGYTFIGWDKDITEVRADRAITARYKLNDYSVVYADFELDEITMSQLTHGELIPVPAPEETIEGKDFVGWSTQNGEVLDGTQSVSDNTILTAKYDVKTFKVDFVDEKNEVISSQTVNYGESAKAPEALKVEGKQFLGWSTDQTWWKVTSDMTVEPILIYEKTALTPAYNIEDTYLGGLLTLTVPEGQKAYYAIDYQEYEDYEQDTEEIPDEDETVSENDIGTEQGPEVERVEWIEYTDDLLLLSDAVVQVKASGENMNDSQTAVIDYTYKEMDNPYTQIAKIEIPKVTGNTGDTIQVPVNLTDNPGIMGAGFTFKYDTELFEQAVVTAGEVLKSGIFTENVNEESGEIKVLWSDVDKTEKTGTLFNVSLRVKDNAEEGDYAFGLEYAAEDTFDQNFQDVNITITMNGGVTIGVAVIGDVNLDSFVNNKDVAYIARSLVGKSTLDQKQKTAADTNGDGKVNNKDVAKLARYLVGKEVSLGGN